MMLQNALLTPLLVLAAFLAGGGLSIQASLNGALAEAFANTTSTVPLSSSMAAVSVSFLGGSLALATLAPFSLGMVKKPSSGKKAPLWYFVFPPMVGSYFISMGTIVAPRLGFAAFFTLTISGQLIVSLLVDHFALFDLVRRPATLQKILSVIVNFVGVVLATSEKASSGSDGDENVILDVFLTLCAGILMGISLPVTTSLTKRVGTFPHRTALFTFSAGCILVSTIFGFSTLVFPFDPELDNVEPWMCTGGFLGAFFVSISVGISPFLGIALFAMCSVSGQLVFSLLVDTFGIANSEKVDLSTLRVVGVILALLGALLFNYYNKPPKPSENVEEDMKKEEEIDEEDSSGKSLSSTNSSVQGDNKLNFETDDSVLLEGDV